MRSLKIGLVAMLLCLVAVFNVTLAQEATPEATAIAAVDNMMAGPWSLTSSLEDVTSDAANFYDERVTLEGVIETIVNVKMFVLGESAVIDNDQLLVVNNSGDEFDLSVTEGQRIQITGVIHPSWQVMNEPAAEPTDAADATAEADPTAEPTREVTPEPMDAAPRAFDLVALLGDSTLEGYEQFTILELTTLDNIALVGDMETITATPADYAGRELLLQGVIEELNTGGTFVLSEGALVDNDRVLIIYDTADMDVSLTDGQRVQVFGTLRQQADAEFEDDLGALSPDFDRALLEKYPDVPVMVARFVMSLIEANR